MSGEVSIYEALGTEEAVERVENLPWQETWVESSTILRIAFCATQWVELASRPGAVFPDRGDSLAVGWLWVQFSSGGKIYAYKDVPEPVHRKILEALSPGSAHALLVKGHYRYAALDPQTGQTYVGVVNGSGLVGS